jgi:hypothetical protein
MHINGAAGALWFVCGLGIWIWAIVDTATKSQSWYQNYPQG